MIHDIIPVIAILMTAGTTLASMAWLVSRLNTSLLGLTQSVEHLSNVVDKVDDKVDKHGERLAALEATAV